MLAEVNVETLPVISGLFIGPSVFIVLGITMVDLALQDNCLGWFSRPIPQQVESCFQLFCQRLEDGGECNHLTGQQQFQQHSP